MQRRKSIRSRRGTIPGVILLSTRTIPGVILLLGQIPGIQSITGGQLILSLGPIPDYLIARTNSWYTLRFPNRGAYNYNGPIFLLMVQTVFLELTGKLLDNRDLLIGYTAL